MVLGIGNSIEIVISAKDQFSKVFKRARLSMEKFRSTALGVAAVGAGIAIGFAKAIQTSIDFESAFTGVRKTVELSEKDFAELEKRFKTLSTETGTTFIELSRIGELAGQLGVEGVDNLSKFTEVIADIAVTTNLTAESAATDFARIANVMQEPLENIDRMGATVVDLGNNFATTEAEIVTFAKRIAGAGAIVGFTTSDTLALGTALSSVGVQAEAGGTAVQMALLKMNDAVIVGGGKLGVFAQTAGLTSDEFAKKWQTDAAGAFEQFILGLGKSGDDASRILDSVGLGSVRAQRAFLSLANAGDLITETLKVGSKAWEENEALIDEAQKRYATMERQIAKTKAKFAILGDEIGDALAPLIRDFLIPVLDKLIKFWSSLSEGQKQAIIVLGLVTVAVSALAAAIAVITLISAPWLFVIGAIILAITGIILLIKNWGKITGLLGEKIKEVADSIKQRFESVKVVIQTIIDLLLTAIKLVGKVTGISSVIGIGGKAISSIRNRSVDNTITSSSRQGVIQNNITVELDGEVVSRVLSNELNNKMSI